jgi:cytochrome subunit of sulfide dehydrogenase
LRAATATAALMASVTAAWAQAPAPRPFSEAEMRQAAYLAANCANCHGTAGRSPGAMPSLAAVPRGYLVQQMKDFRDGRRPATLMHQLAKGYTDEQFELLGEYFARQKNQ